MILHFGLGEVIFKVSDVGNDFLGLPLPLFEALKGVGTFAGDRGDSVPGDDDDLRQSVKLTRTSRIRTELRLQLLDMVLGDSLTIITSSSSFDIFILTSEKDSILQTHCYRRCLLHNV